MKRYVVFDRKKGEIVKVYSNLGRIERYFESEDAAIRSAKAHTEYRRYSEPDFLDHVEIVELDLIEVRSSGVKGHL